MNRQEVFTKIVNHALCKLADECDIRMPEGV